MPMLTELLSQDEKNMFMSYVKAYAGRNSDNCYPNVSVEHLLRYWDTNKQKLFHAFGDKFILSKEIEFAQDHDELCNRMSTLVAESRTSGGFMQEYYERFVFGMDYRDSRRFSSLICDENLVTNRFDGDTFTIDLPNGKKLTINEGCKVTRALGKIANAFNMNGFERFRIDHSMAINHKITKGNLCISIHPLDFITMSDNECDWSSCMSWQEDGCYRRGTVEMMNSPIVAVAYLTSESDMYMPGGYRWNSKKWRELYVIDRDIITNILSYPYRNFNITKEVLRTIRGLFPEDAYTKDFCEYRPYNRTHIEPLDATISVEPHTYAMYNDFGSDTTFGYFNPELCDGVLDFVYSGDAVCMVCGKNEGYYDGEGSLVCEDCEPVFRCCNCGDSYDSDELYCVDGDYYCHYCYDERCTEDYVTGDVHDVDTMKPLAVFDKNTQKVRYHFGVYLDIQCEKDEQRALDRIPYLQKATNPDYEWNYFYCVNAEDVDDELLEQLGCYDSIEELKETINEYYDNGGCNGYLIKPLQKNSN